MLTVMRGVERFRVVDLMITQLTFNSQYFGENALAPAVSKVFPQGRRRRAPRLHCPLDNRRVHFSKMSDNFIAENEIVDVPHPCDSPDSHSLTLGSSVI
jgi:hypothetical protein